MVLEQSCGPSPGQPEKQPLHIPVRVGLLGRATGAELCPERVLELREPRQVGARAGERWGRPRLGVDVQRYAFLLAAQGENGDLGLLLVDDLAQGQQKRRRG